MYSSDEWYLITDITMLWRVKPINQSVLGWTCYHCATTFHGWCSRLLNSVPSRDCFSDKITFNYHFSSCSKWILGRCNLHRLQTGWSDGNIILKYLAFYNNESVPSIIKDWPKQIENFAKYWINPQKLSKNFNFKVEKYR